MTILGFPILSLIVFTPLVGVVPTVNAVGTSARGLGGALRLTQNGIIENYAVGIAVGTVAILWWLVF